MAISRDNLLVWIGVVTTIAAVGLLLAGMPAAGLMIVIPIAIFTGLCANLSYVGAKPLRRFGLSQMRPRDIHAAARDLLDSPKWRIRRQEPEVTSLERRLPLNPGLVIFVALLGVVPAIGYIVMCGNRYQVLTVRTSFPSGATQVDILIQPRDSNGERIVDWLWGRIAAPKVSPPTSVSSVLVNT